MRPLTRNMSYALRLLDTLPRTTAQLLDAITPEDRAIIHIDNGVMTGLWKRGLADTATMAHPHAWGWIITERGRSVLAGQRGAS